MKTIYTPRGRTVKEGAKTFSDLYLMVYEIISSKDLTWIWFLRDLKAKYRQTLLGVLWVILMPLITVAIFVGMHRAGVFNYGNVTVPYPLYALLGITIWGIFSAGISRASNSLISAGSMLIKINFPRTSLVLAATLQGIVDFFIRLFLAVILMVWYEIPINPARVALGLASLIPLYLFTLGLGFIIALISGVFRDLPAVINIVLMILMLSTPVLYSSPKDNILFEYNVYNPLNYLINTPRDMILYGFSLNTTGYLVSSVIALLLFVFGWRLFYISQTKITERI